MHVLRGRQLWTMVIGALAAEPMQSQITARICIAALSAAALSLSVLGIEIALAVETGGPVAREVLVRSQESKWIVRAEGASPMSRCLATWDRTSGMSKKQWKATCKRVVKENPRLYSRPF